MVSRSAISNQSVYIQFGSSYTQCSKKDIFTCQYYRLWVSFHTAYMEYRITSNNSPHSIIAPKHIFYSPTAITIHTEIVHHSNYRSTRIIRFSKIYIFSIIEEIFSCKISFEINNPGAIIRS